jgi:hypothetical protein
MQEFCPINIVIVVARAALSCRRSRRDYPRCATRRGLVGFEVVID